MTTPTDRLRENIVTGWDCYGDEGRFRDDLAAVLTENEQLRARLATAEAVVEAARSMVAALPYEPGSMLGGKIALALAALAAHDERTGPG